MEFKETLSEERYRLVEYLPLPTLNGVLLLTWMVDGHRRRWLREDLRRELSAECLRRVGPELFLQMTAGLFAAQERYRPWMPGNPEVDFRQASWDDLSIEDAAVINRATGIVKVSAAAAGLKLFLIR